MTTQTILNVTETISSDADPMLVWSAMIDQAVRGRVSDVHMMAQDGGYELLFRVDGDLRSQGTFAREFARRLINHVKSAAEMDVAESRRPTEGRMKAVVDGRPVDLRIGTVPTIHGQDMTVRILDRGISLLDLPQLGMLHDQLDYAQDAITRPSGLILIAGPSGSGKTTTLYAMLRHLAGRGRKISTIEEPVEYNIPGISQAQVNAHIGVTFASLLSAILRQDPDVIMVGEVRDQATAVTAVRAANTGHLVLATTHATRASRALETMLSLGVHPYFLAVALRCVIAQVLVKRICPQCRTALPETADMILEPEVRRRLEPGVSTHLYQGAGCEACQGSGYRGRLALFEMLLPGDQVRKQILDRRPADEIGSACASGGMLTLEQAGKIAAVTGLTSLEEVVDTLPMV
jgi:type II secretory ATPase GspE/PulE/Tfp pilus assembly ATPase PilB-like protein